MRLHLRNNQNPLLACCLAGCLFLAGCCNEDEERTTINQNNSSEISEKIKEEPVISDWLILNLNENAGQCLFQSTSARKNMGGISFEANLNKGVQTEFFVCGIAVFREKSETLYEKYQQQSQMVSPKPIISHNGIYEGKQVNISSGAFVFGEQGKCIQKISYIINVN